MTKRQDAKEAKTRQAPSKRDHAITITHDAMKWF